MAVIRDIGYWIWSNEHGKWWRPDSNGYTDCLEEAGIYSHVETQQILTGANIGIPKGRVMKEYAIPVNAWNGR